MEDFLWLGPILQPGGYGAVARNYLRGLAEVGARAVPCNVVEGGSVADERDGALFASLPQEPTGHDTAVVHLDPRSMAPVAEFARTVTDGPVVGCTIAETDRIPPDWAEACNQLDEIWVPSEFNRLTFARSGVDQDRLRVVPYGLDMHGWPADGPTLESLPADRFCFVYCFAYDWRKGFDVLLAAYLQEFTAAEPVTLVLKAFDPPGGARPPMLERFEAAVRPLGASLQAPGAPHVSVLDQHIHRDILAALLRRADLYVSTERANGWGMPCMEAMAMNRPAAALDWGGSTEWMHDGNALLLAPGPLVGVDARLCAERPEFSGQRWPEMAVADVRALLRDAVSRRSELNELGARAGTEVRERWTAAHAAEAIVNRNGASAYRPRDGLSERLRPRLGLAAQTPLAGARERVLVAAFDGPEGTWRTALDAHLGAFADADPVTLCLLAPAGTDPGALEGAVVRHLAERGADPERIPDTILTVADPEEALVAPGVRALVEPAPLWPHNLRRVAPTPEALREAA